MGLELDMSCLREVGRWWGKERSGHATLILILPIDTLLSLSKS